MATLYPQPLLQLFDNLGNELAGGKVYSYEGGTSTPLVTYQDRNGATANANPVVLDSAGRATIRITEGVSYKFIVKDSADVTIATYDHIIEGTVATAANNDILVSLTYCGNPGAQAFLGGHEVTNAFTFPANFSGSAGSVQTNPAATYDITVKKNGVAAGTVSVSTAGVFTFTTSGGASVSCVFGDTISFHAPDSGTAADILVTLLGDLA